MEDQPEQTSPTAPTETQPGPKKSPYVLYAIIAVTILIVLAGVLFMANKEEEGTPTESTSTSQTPSPAVPLASPTPVAPKISVKETGKLILPGGHADPTVVPIASGYRMYVNTFGKGPSGYLTYTSPDGETWTKEKDIIIPGVATGRAIVLPTGIRFYYPGSQPIKPSDPQADMYSTFAADGLNFKKDPGTILTPRSSAYYVEGPTVFQLPDKTWRMYFNENSVAAGNQRDGTIWGASSTDGTTWTRDAAVTLEGEASSSKGAWPQVLHPFVVANPAGGFIMFYNTHSEIYFATSADGLSWEKHGKIGVRGADADGYFQKDGTFRLFYGDFTEKDGGLVYSAVLNITTSSSATSATTTPKAGTYVDYKSGIIESTPGTKILFFHAPWCPQCRALEASIKANTIPENTTIIKVDYDTNQALRKTYGVTIQTSLVSVNDSGELIKKFVAYDDPSLAAVIKNLL
jgi:thiol-disulfide isomerase/thioredoxin